MSVLRGRRFGRSRCFRQRSSSPRFTPSRRSSCWWSDRCTRRGNWWVAGLVGALAALTRSYGVFLVAPLVVLFIQERGFYIRRMIPTGFAVVLPVIGPAIFSWHLDRIWGDPWA